MDSSTITRRPGPHMTTLPTPFSSTPSSSAEAQRAFLTRLTEDAKDRSTPLGAFLAGLPQPPKRRAKTSSERGRAFRERQQRREEDLERSVVQLRRDVARLDMQRQAWEARSLQRRSSPTGSLAQLIRTYHRLFANGLDTLAWRVGGKRGAMDEHEYGRIQLQEAFLRRAIDETGVVGNEVGPEASIVQWRRYTQSHYGFQLEHVSMEISESYGEDEDDDEHVVTVTAHCFVHGRLSLDTFKLLFPHVLSNDALLDRMIGTSVTYPASRRFQFTHDGRVAVEAVDVDFIAGLKNAGFSLADVAVLMQGAAVTRDSMIVEVEPTTAPIAPRSGPEKAVPPRNAEEARDAEERSARYRMSFLCGDATAA